MKRLLKNILKCLLKPFHIILEWIFKHKNFLFGYDYRLVTACHIGHDINGLQKRGIIFAHLVGVVISKFSKIGNGTMIWQCRGTG